MQRKTSESGVPPDETSFAYQGWGVVAACFVMAIFSWGLGFYSLGIYLSELQQANGWPTSLISGATTFYYLFSALLLVFVGDAMTRLGPRTVVLTGICCFAVAGALLPVISQPWQLYATYIILAFGWATMSLASIVTILGMWFEARRGLAISLSLNGASCGGIIVAPALAAGSAEFGFAPAMLAAIAVMMAAMLPLVLMVIGRPPRPAGASSSDEDSAEPANARITRRSAIRSPAFWTVTGPFSLGLLAQVGVLVHLVPFLEPQIGRSAAGLAVGVTTAMAVVGRVSLGTLMHRLDARVASAISLFTQAVALLVLQWTGEPAVLFVCCAIFGFSVGNLITFPSIIVQREFLARDFALVIGLSTSINQFAYSFGPAILGVLRDASGTYHLAFISCAVLFLLGAAGILIRVPSARK